MYCFTSLVDHNPVLFWGGPASSFFMSSLRCLRVRKAGLPVCFMLSFAFMPLSWKRQRRAWTVRLFRLVASAISSMLAPFLRCIVQSNRIFGFALFSVAYKCSNSSRFTFGRKNSPFGKSHICSPS